MAKYHLKKKYKKILGFILLLILSVVFVISFVKILNWNHDNKNNSKIKTSILNNVDINEIDPSLINDIEVYDEPGVYFKYKDVSLINVNINELKKENSDTIGWIQVEGTEINYPLVQSKDNTFYLKHDYLKKYNTGGWIFLDYRNNINDLSQNNVIYGHRRKNNSMFGTLKNVLTEKWYKNENNHIIKLSTLKYSYLFQIFSVYTTPNETYYIKSNFKDYEYQEFINTIISRSKYNFNVGLTTEDKILTLSTCYNTNDRLAVHAKLIKTVKL